MVPLNEMTSDMIADVLQAVPKYGPTDFRSLVEKKQLAQSIRFQKFSTEKQESHINPNRLKLIFVGPLVAATMWHGIYISAG